MRVLVLFERKFEDTNWVIRSRKSITSDYANPNEKGQKDNK
jgi:hypothetical protein